MKAFEIFTRNNGRFYYRVITESGHNILSSDGYVEKKECQDVIEDVKEYFRRRKPVPIEQVTDDQWKFTLTNPENMIIGYSMIFHSRSQCEKWIRLMEEHLPLAETVELNPS